MMRPTSPFTNRVRERVPSISVTQTRDSGVQEDGLLHLTTAEVHPAQSSSVIDYLQRRPLAGAHKGSDQADVTGRPPPLLLSSQRKGGSGAKGGGEQGQRQYYAIKRTGKNSASSNVETVLTRMKVLSSKTKKMLLFRMIGAALGSILVVHFTLLAALPAVCYMLGRKVGFSLLLCAFSSSFQLLFAHVGSLALIRYDYDFRSKWEVLWESVGRAPVQLAFLIRARVFSAIVVTGLSCFGLCANSSDISIAALIGVFLTALDIANQRFYLDWTVQFKDLEHSKKTSTRNSVVCSLRRHSTRVVSMLAATLLISTFIIAVANRFGDNLTCLRLLSEMLFSPFPLWGAIGRKSVSQSMISRLAKLLIVALFSNLTAYIFENLQSKTSQALSARCFDSERDVLLSLTGKTMTDQLALWSHLLKCCSFCQESSDPFTSARIAASVNSELIVLEEERKGCHGEKELCERITGGLHSSDYGVRSDWFVPRKTLLEAQAEYKHLRDKMSPIPGSILPRWIRKGAQRAGGVCASWIWGDWIQLCSMVLQQHSASNWTCRGALYLLQPHLFLGIRPHRFTRSQLSVLLGSEIGGFFSPFSLGDTFKLVNVEVVRILLGHNQMLLALLHRHLALMKGLKSLCDFTQNILVTPPTGIFVRGAANETVEPSSVRSNFKRNRSDDCIFRFDKGIKQSLRQALFTLLGKEPNMMSFPMQNWVKYVEIRENGPSLEWLEFNDNTIGLSLSARAELIALAKKTLKFCLDLCWLSSESSLNLMRARQIFLPHEFGHLPMGLTECPSEGSVNPSSVDGNFLGLDRSIRDKLKMHFPSFNMGAEVNVSSAELDRSFNGENAPESTTFYNSSLSSVCNDLVSTAESCMTSTERLAAIPNCPPYAIRSPTLAKAAKTLSIYLEVWLSEFQKVSRMRTSVKFALDAKISDDEK